VPPAEKLRSGDAEKLKGFEWGCVATPIYVFPYLKADSLKLLPSRSLTVTMRKSLFAVCLAIGASLLVPSVMAQEIIRCDFTQSLRTVRLTAWTVFTGFCRKGAGRISPNGRRCVLGRRNCGRETSRSSVSRRKATQDNTWSDLFRFSRLAFSVSESSTVPVSRFRLASVRWMHRESAGGGD